MSDVRVMSEHIDYICRRNQVRVGQHSRGGNASRRGRFINIRPIKSSVTYAVALHELGHVLGPWQSKPRLYKEAGAWKWALENALCWTPVMQKTMVRALTSYLHWQERRQKYVRLPEADHDFWRLIGQ